MRVTDNGRKITLFYMYDNAEYDCAVLENQNLMESVYELSKSAPINYKICDSTKD